MILLVENWNADARRLAYSLEASGYTYDAVVIQYDGFCPAGTISPYEYFIYGDEIPAQRNPIYFDKLPVPELFEIRSSNTGGEIYDYEDLRGKIFYAEPKEDRYIRIVDWINRDGKVCCSDHYDQYGHRFAQTIMDKNQKPVHKTYYRPNGTEVITENLLTGDLILSLEGKNKIFHTKSDFVVYYLQHAKKNIERIVYNSLSLPFFITNRYCAQVKPLKHNVLFWQEPIGEDIPGNMKGLLNENLAGTEIIAVQNRSAFDKIQQLNIDHGRFRSLGFIYPENRHNTFGKDALIFTNSDQVTYLKELAEQLPNIHFHVGALTEMSAKLLQMAIYPNIHLYPTITDRQIQILRQTADLYLDINMGNEILNAVENAFTDQMLLLGFENTLHHRSLVNVQNIFTADQEGVKALAEKIRSVTSEKKIMEKAMQEQMKAANAQNADDYRKILG